jgi:hypothetical protein
MVEAITPLLQRQVEPEEEEEEEEEGEEEKEGDGFLQAKHKGGRPVQAGLNLAAQVNSLKGNGRPLPKDQRIYFEPLFGYDFSRVRLHTDGRAAEAARTIKACAFTTGREIVFGAGQYAPGTEASRRLMAHELVHVL